MDEEPDSTKFHVLRPQKAKFAVVIDVSGSMSKYRRLTRVQQSATDWIQYDVLNGSSVAIVTFSYVSKFNLLQTCKSTLFVEGAG